MAFHDFRDKATALNRARVLKSIDNLKVCSIVCIYIPRKYAEKGATEQILISLIEFAKLNGIKILEAYPVDSNGKKTIASFVYTGFYSTYIRFGFVEIISRSISKPILRYYIEYN